jgi:plasmid segregation protein ParM
MQQTIIAIDVGRSAVKVRAYAGSQTYEAIFPAASSPAVRLSDEASAQAAAKETVEIDGRAYFTGNSARLQGDVKNAAGLSSDWVDSTEYRALLLSSIKRLADMGVPNLIDPYIVVGTPAAHYLSQRTKLEEVTRKTIPGTIKALSQPMGAFLSYYIDPNGFPAKDRVEDAGRRRSYAAIDVGFFSTDFVLMREGVHVESKSDSCEGVYVAAEKLLRILGTKGIKVKQLDCDRALRTKTVQHFGSHNVNKEVEEAVAELFAKILPKAEALFADEVAQLDAVLLAGGGAELVYESIRSKWPNTVLLADARMAVEEGFCRYAKGMQLKRQYSVAGEARGAVHA